MSLLSLREWLSGVAFIAQMVSMVAAAVAVMAGAALGIIALAYWLTLG